MNTLSNKPVPLHLKQATARTFEMDIILGHLRPGQRLIEDELMARFSQSRHRIRTAIDALALRGLVVRETNKGAHVCDYTVGQMSQMFELRNILHDAAIRRISFPISQDVIDSLHALNKAHAKASTQGDIEEAFHISNRFQRMIFECCGNAVLAAVIEQQAQRGYPAHMRLFTLPGYLLLAQNEHRQMIAALEQADADALISLCCSHIARSMQNQADDGATPVPA